MNPMRADDVAVGARWWGRDEGVHRGVAIAAKSAL